MAVTVQGNPRFLAVDENGNPRVGAKLFTYEVGTSTKKSTYTDATLASANTNPTILDSNGEASVWLNGDYKFVLAPSNDTDPPASPYWTVDSIGTAAATSAISGEVLNGSFEHDDSVAGVPDNWTLTGTWVMETASNPRRGATHLKATGTGSNVATSEFIEVTPSVLYTLDYSQKSSNGTNTMAVDIENYSSAQVLLSTTAAVAAAAISSSWENKTIEYTPGATTAYIKLKFTTVVAAGTTSHLDAVALQSLKFLQDAHTVAGAWTFSGAITATGGISGGAGSFTTLSVSGATNLDAGTLAAPGLYFEGETGSGIYRIGANNHGYTISGTKILDISSTGLAVTGTLSSTEPLTITKATGVPRVTLTASTGTNEAYVNISNTGGTYYFGAENSAGSWFGATAYALAFSAPSGRVVDTLIAGSKITTVSSTGLEVTGTVRSTEAASNNTATHYWYESSSDGILRRKTLANVKTELLTPTAATNFSAGQVTYIKTNVATYATGFNVATNIGAAWESIGPTSSGATNIWTDMDNIPSGAVAIIFKAVAYDLGAGGKTTSLFARETGSATGNSYHSQVLGDYTSSNADYIIREHTVPLDSSKRFDLYYSGTAGTCVIYIVGFIAPGF